MPGSKRHVPMDRRSLLNGCGQRSTPKRSKKLAVGLNERYFSSKFNGYDVKRTTAYT